MTDRQAYSPIERDPNTGLLQTKIGSVCLQVQQGNLVKETTSAIVNSVGRGLDLKGWSGLYRNQQHFGAAGFQGHLRQIIFYRP